MAQLAEWWKNETFIPLDWSPAPEPPAPRRRRWVRRVTALFIAALVLTSVGLGGLAWHEHQVAHKDDVLMNRQATQLRVLQTQITASRRTLSSTSSVASELQACIDASGQASSDLFGFLTGSEKKAESICNTAEADYQQLQSPGSGSAH